MQPESTPLRAGKDDGIKLAQRAEYVVVWAACLIAGLRIFVFSSAFPFFNNVDELEHFDLILRYAHFGPQLRITPYSKEACEYIAVFGSPEYSAGPTTFPGGIMLPPIWMLPGDLASARFQHRAAHWLMYMNHEGSSAPLYYSAAAIWWHIGQGVGLEGLDLLYWLRWLNILLGMALVWLGYWAVRLVLPGPSFPCLAAAVLLAFFPQDTFYAIESDVLSPVLFGLAFIGLIKLWRSDMPSLGLAALTGLALSATTLVKATNLPLLAVSALAIAAKMWQLSRTGKLRASLPCFGLLAVCVLLPVGGWMFWNYIALGDVTGTAQRNRLMGWTNKPVRLWFSHPLFSLAGEKLFWKETLASFWRGELCWAGKRMASPWADAFYCLSSVILVAANLPGLLLRGRGLSFAQRTALWTSLASLAALLSLLVFTSISFDFGHDMYPSRAKPFLTSGRLASAALIPFLLLYVRGLDCLLGWPDKRWVRLAGLAAIILVINISEIQVNLPAFSSLYNFYHRVPLNVAVANVPAVYVRPVGTAR